MSNSINKLLFILKTTLMVIIALMFFCVGTYNVQAVDYIKMESTSLVHWMMSGEDLKDGYYALTVNNTTYNIHLYVLEGDQVWTSNKTFGDANDVGTASAHAKNMVAVLVKGNVTVASGVTVTAYKSTYGGPKGLFIYTTGTLENNGTITMYGRGAYAAGQNVYLWYDEINGNGYTGFTVPAAGGAGAARSTTATLSNDGRNWLHGNKGTNGTGRATGGGGSGAVRNYVARMYPGSGAAGTSYSGGTGGGAAATDRASSRTAGSGAANGGRGGHGAQGGAATGNSGGSTNGWGQAPGGGQGNGPGNNVWSHASASVPTQDTGTGGLLILFCRSLNNKGNINANGVTARYTTVSKWTGSQGGGHILSGGSSGGGSVNIFYTELVQKGTITATGGPSQTRSMSYRGGAGGNGTVTTNQLILEEEFLNPTLSSLEVDGQTMYPTFDKETYQYGVTLDSEESTVNINATLTHEENTITSGVGTFDIPIGTSTHNIVVTSKVGMVQVYSIEFYRPPSSYKYLKNITIDGEKIENFDPTVLTHNITIPYDKDTFELDVIRGRTSQEVYGTGTITTKSGNNTVTLTVISEDGNYVTNYTLNIYREHSSKLKSLVLGEYELDPVFDPETNTYSVTIMSTALALSVDAKAYDEEATITLKGFGYIKSSQTGTITVTEPNSSPTTYTINIIKEGTPAVTQYSYSYTGGYQTFTAPATGFYQIELWGAQGGNAVGNNSRVCSYNRGNAYGGGCGGFGAYTTGTIKLDKGETLYVYVGQRGINGKASTNRAGGWNGGGSSTYDHSDDEASGSGGGATDIRLVATSSKTVWNEFASLKSRIMVAAGGGGGSDVYAAGSGGTLTSSNARFSRGVTQTSGYAFGYGENSVYRVSNKDVAGGGGGYFGGYSTASSSSNYSNFGHVGTGGSSFVSGCTGCVALDESSTSQSNLVFSNSNVHYSGYEFTDIKMVAGGASMPSTSTGYTVGNVSNGYARITMVNKSENNFLSSITVKATDYETNITAEKEYTPDYVLETEDYYVELEPTETTVTLSARPEDSTATIEGLGTYDIPAGTTDLPITVTAENGNIKVYTVHVTRPASDNPYPIDIVISGLVPSLCSASDAFCNLNPENFDKDTTVYYLTVPSRIKQLWFDVEKGHPYQVVSGEGKTTLEGGENIITIEVESEDGTASKVYQYYVTRDMTGNTDLSILDVVDPDREINYDPDITEYYLSIPNDYTKIEELVVETDDENASYIISGNEDFETGMNQVNILVTAANGETKTYTLNVYREKSGNTYLSNLEVINGTTSYDLTPEFNKVYLGNYQVTVPNDISTVEIVATPEVTTTTVSGTGEKELSTGTNNFSITTTAEDGSVEIYQLVITREKNNNTNLTNISVKDSNKEYSLNPIFDSSTLEYNVLVDEGVTTIQITATPEVETTTYQLLDSNTIKIGTNTKRVMAIAEDGTTKTYTINITRPASSNTYLSSLTLEDSNTTFALTPTFDKETTDYTLEVENSVKTITVTGIAEDKLSKVTGNGKYALASGNNEITVSVTSEDGNIRDYTVIVTRKPSSNAYLSDITLSTSTVSPEFDKETTSYTVNVGSTVEKLTINGIPEDETTTVTGNQTYSLVTGENTVTLTTIAEDGVSTKTYTITIIKDKSDNANIKNLYLEEGVLSPSFDPNVISYTTKVPYNVDKATFHVTLADSKSTYEISGNENFQTGENTVVITVTSEDGTTKDYTIVVTKREAPTNSDYLASLTVDKGTLTPAFNKEKQYYEVEVDYSVKSITVSATPEDSYATVIGTGSYELSVGDNMIVVTVTSADGVDRDYQVLVKRAKNTDARLSNVVISGITLNQTFDKDVTNYTLTTTDTELHFTKIVTVDSNATYEIIGNSFTENKTHEVIIRVTAQDEVTTKDYVFTVTKAPSNNNNLSSLKVDGYELSPQFNKATTLYTVTVPKDVMTVNVEATPEHKNSTVTGTGSLIVYTGENQILVDVTSESGNVKTYTILLYKEGSTNSRLADLIVNNGTMSPEFDGDTLDYQVTVPYSEEELDLIVIPEDGLAYYEVVNNTLSVGNNTVYVLVTSESGNVSTYTLNVTREDLITALLKNIEVKNYELSAPFNSYVKNYDVLIDYEITKLNLTVVPIDSKATYVIEGNEDLQIGTNKITITVTSRDGKQTEIYTLNVTRQAYSNTFLDYLYTDQGDVTPNFDKNVLSYTIDVDNSVTTIELFGEAVDKSATVTGIGVHSLQTGENKIPITVTTTTGIKRTYYVTVNRGKSTANYLETLQVKVESTLYDLTPEFDKETNNYTLEVPIGTKELTLSGTISENATVTGLGTKAVKVGDNTYEIKVTSENGDINTYTIVVTREASTNNYLTDLIPSVGTLEPDFGYEEVNYTLNLDSSAGILSFTYSTEDTNATVTGASSQVVPDGISTREIVVTAEDKTTRTYTITINKERSDIANLSSLSVTGYPFDVEFDPDVYEYTINVENSKNVLLATEVIAVAEDANAVVTKSGNLNLKTGTNEYIVKVTAPDGFTSKQYKIIINRALGSNSLLSNLVVNTGEMSPNFNPNTNSYEWLVKKGTVITKNSLTATLADANATINMTEEELEIVSMTGNTFVIKVTSEDKTSETTYTLNITYDLSNDTTLKELIIDKGYYLPKFNPDVFEYDVYEYIDTESINISATPTAETSTITAGTGKVTLTSDETTHIISITAEDGTVGIYTLNIHKSILTDKGLKNLGLNGLENLECINDKCKLSPTFDTDIIEYSIKVPYEYTNLDILAETENSQQTVKYKINGEYIETYSLPVGTTSVIVEVYDGMGEKTKEYTLAVERCKSNNTNLASLKVSYELDSEITVLNLDPEFDKNTLEYTVTVPYEVQEVSITATVEDSDALIAINGYNYLEEGNNDATVTVTASDGTVKTYIVHIIRSPLYNSYLKNITVSTGVFWDLSPSFKSTVFDYTTTISSLYDKVTIEAIPLESSTLVSGTGEYEVVVGSNIFTLTATAVDGSISVYKVNVIKENSRNVNLSNLIVEEGNLSPSFEKGTTKYDINVAEDVDKLTIHAVLEDPSSSYIVTGNENLISGENIVNVIVMSQDKSASKTYQLTVHKAASSNNNLSSLVVKDETTTYPLSPTFDKDILNYKVDLNHDIEKVTIEATSEHLLANITGTGEEYLAYGSNIKQVTVTAEDGSVEVYTIDIYRNYNLDLKLIVSDIGDLVPDFDKDTLEYKITLPTEEDEITFVAQKESDKVTVIGSGTYDLVYGENTIDFVVEAPDGMTKTYTVIVEREYSDNNYIESLVIHEGALEPEFNKETLEYEVSVRNTVTQLGMDIILEDENATYEVIGNENLQPGPNEVIIRVTAANKETRDYKINVILQDDSYFSNLLLDISITNGELNPDFDKEINYYAATVPNSITSTEITVIKESVDATVEGIGVKNLEPGRNIFQVKVTSKDGIVNTYTLVIYRDENSDATLSSLTVKNHNYLPIFNKLEESYTLNVESDVTKLDIEAVPTDPNSTVEITGNKNLVTGKNIVKIKVTAPDGTTTKTYTITVNKVVSTNNYLSNLEVIGYTLSPEYLKTNPGPYTVNVENNVNSIVVDGTAEVETTTITGLGSYNLTTGENIIKVQATSESGEVRIYTLIINRSKNSDSSLKNIILSDGTLDPVFNPDTLEYEVKVDTELENITVTGVVNSGTSTVTGNGIYTLEEAETEIKLEVEAENGSKTIYKVNVIKDTKSSSKILKLVIKEGQLYPTFHKNTTNYTILVPNEITSLQDMEITLEDENATYDVIGNSNFKVGSNTVTIRVTSADTTTTTDYTISVVRQIVGSNYLKDLEVVGYTLNPKFDKNTLYYEVNVPNEVEQVQIKATKEDTNATLSGTGYKTLNYSENRFYVTVTSASGAVRTYSVVINRTLANENLLLSLTPSVGTLSPTFDSYTNEYTLEVPEKTDTLTLDGTASDNTTVVGLGTSNVEVGEKTRTISVTSQTGETNIYTVKVVRPASTNTELDSLTPSSGTLEYSNDILEYEMTVEDNVSVISFDAIPTDSDATITGNSLTTLNYGENEIVITVIAEDKVTTREIKITVIRQKEITAIIPSETDLILSVGEEKEITYTLEPTDTSYTGVEWISNNESIATVDENGKITALDIGSTTIEIRSTHNPLISATITVNVISKEITSSIYEINREGEIPYVIGSDPKTMISDFIPNFDNNPSTLYVFDENDTEITDLNSYVGSYMKIKLIINEITYDELTIAVRGDLNGDGLVTAVDLVAVKNQILGKNERTYLSMKIADTTQDGLVTAPDLVKVKNYILGKSKLN